MAALRYACGRRDLDGRLSVRRLGIDDAMPAGLIVRRRAEFFLSWFQSPAEVRDRAGIQQARAGDVICYAPGDAPRFGHRRARWRNSWLALSGPLAERWLAGFPCDRLLRLGDAASQRFTLLALHHELTSYGDPNPTIVANLVENLIASLRRQLGGMHLRDTVPAALREAWTRLTVGCADAALSVEGVATAVGLSRSALIRGCRRHFGCAPAELLQRSRLDLAQGLLTRDAMSISEVAAAAGYGGAPYFARVVRRRLGCSPRELRERLRRAPQAMSSAEGAS